MSDKTLNIITNILGILSFLFGGYLAYEDKDYKVILIFIVIGIPLIVFKNSKIRSIYLKASDKFIEKKV